MKSVVKRSLVLFSGVIFICGSLCMTFAQEGQVDINALVQETQKMSQDADEMTLIWWIPEEFWQVSFEQDPGVSAAEVEEFMKLLRPFVLVVAVDGRIGSFGGITYKSESSIRGNIRLIDSGGGLHRPLNDENIDADTKNFLAMIKPVFVNMLGQMGENMHFILFPAKDNNGQRIAVAKSKSSFAVRLSGKDFTWDLPLDSLVPAQICPKCQHKCSGSWNFCPMCGTALAK